MEPERAANDMPSPDERSDERSDKRSDIQSDIQSDIRSVKRSVKRSNEPPQGRPNDASDEPPKTSPARSASFIRAGTYAGLGFQFVVAILLFLYAGQWVDGKLGTKPLFLVIGVFVGAGAAFYSMYARLMADQKREDESGRD